uniref:Uncharacterized protein n=1 Tax=Spongospora subterranea TaxID=70186 RepID=A0A0H5RFK1_9EUKA|eukprot:CRZ12317.1 hypothetical protein [Spongospora subterranea]
MVRLVETSAQRQLRTMPSESSLQAQLITYQNEMRDILSDGNGFTNNDDSMAERRVVVRVQELLEARRDLTRVYGTIQEDIDTVSHEICQLRYLVDRLGNNRTTAGTRRELAGEPEDEADPALISAQLQDFARVRIMIDAAQEALRSLDDRRNEVFSRITSLQNMLSRQASMESAFERSRINRVLALEQSIRDIHDMIKTRQTLEAMSSRPTRVNRNTEVRPISEDSPIS